MCFLKDSEKHFKSLAAITVLSWFITFGLGYCIWYGYNGWFTPVNHKIVCSALNETCLEYVDCKNLTKHTCDKLVCSEVVICYTVEPLWSLLSIPLLFSSAFGIIGTLLVVEVLKKQL